ncbi:MAG: RnfH family protein [Gammaproteobacteria bacterium]|nr:RnfH family protein [Gammaproteobacteria bacterium]
MKIQVIYINQNSQFLSDMELSKGASVQHAIIQSGLLEEYPNISLDKHEVGIFGELVSLETVLQEGDRVEVYRPLAIDPMEARRLRAQHD